MCVVCSWGLGAVGRLSPRWVRQWWGGRASRELAFLCKFGNQSSHLEKNHGTTITDLVLEENCTPKSTSDLVGLFFVELDGESPRSKLEQEHGQTDSQKGQKISGDDDAAGTMSQVGRHHELEAAECSLEFDCVYLGTENRFFPNVSPCGFVRGKKTYFGGSPMNWFRLIIIMNISNPMRDLAHVCEVPGTTDQFNRRSSVNRPKILPWQSGE